jgi:hypothetical protein
VILDPYRFAVDIHAAQVVFAVHFDGQSNGSTTFVDVSPIAATLTAVGAAQISTTSPALGSGSYLGDGSTSRVEAPANAAYEAGSGNLTVECYVKFTSTAWMRCLGLWSGGAEAWTLEVNGGVARFLGVNTGATTFITAVGVTSINDGNWHHIAAVRSGSTTTLYVDGVSDAVDASSSGTFRSATGRKIVIGAKDDGVHPFDGNIDMARVTVGVARTPAEFWTSI